MSALQALVFDLGGTHLRCGVLDAAGAVHHATKRRILSVAQGASPREIWDGVLDAVLAGERAHRGALPPDAPIVLAFPGPIAGQRTILHAPTLTGSAERAPDLAGLVEGATGRPVFLLNDVSAAAWHFSTRTSARRFLVVTVSSGIGSKLFDREHAAQVLDDPIYAGEIGHYVVDDAPDAPVCECGGRGHLGAIASGRAIERAARDRARVDPAAFRASWHGRRAVTGAALTNEDHLVPAALAGDPWTLALIREGTRPLSRTLLAVLMAAGLDRIFLIGGFAQALGECYLRIVRAQMAEMSRYGVAGALTSLVELAAVHEETCLAGCGAFVRHSGRPGTDPVAVS